MAALTADIRWIVGLGNPGADYVGTRHNAGFWLVDLIAAEQAISMKFDKKHNADEGKFRCEGKDIHLQKPLTFMNRSGQAVSAMARYYKIKPEQILVLHDELDLPAGTNRIKQGGGHGGRRCQRCARPGPGGRGRRHGDGHGRRHGNGGRYVDAWSVKWNC